MPPAFIGVNRCRNDWANITSVERIIGNKTGTGGSSGAPFLRRALELTFFPELYAVRTEIPG